MLFGVCITESPRIVCYVNVAIDLLALSSPHPLHLPISLPCAFYLHLFFYPHSLFLLLSRFRYLGCILM